MGYDPQLLRAQFPERYVVLGLELKPFCLGHHCLLHRINSPLIDDKKRDVYGRDVLVATALCSFTWEEGQTFLEDVDGAETQLAILNARSAGQDLSQKGDLLMQYMVDGSRRPDFTIDEGGTGGPTIWNPWQQRMRVRLMRDLRLSESEVMNRPLTLNWWDYLTLCELDGSLRICTEEEKALVTQFANRTLTPWPAQQN